MPARALEATILFTLHDFEAAYVAADALVREDPANTSALATRFDAELELGRHRRGPRRPRAADRGRRSGRDHPRSPSRLGHRGPDEAALAKARTARAAALADGTPDAAFYAYAVGEYARLAGMPPWRGAHSSTRWRRVPRIPRRCRPRPDRCLRRSFEAAIAGLRRATEIAPSRRPWRCSATC